MSSGLKPQQKKLLPAKKKCSYCLDTVNLTYDHKKPLSRGGSNAPGNIQVLCAPCNGTKSSLSDGEVRRYARWFFTINKKRAEKGKRPFGIRKADV